MNIGELFQDYLFETVITGIFMVVVLIPAFIWGSKRMQKLSASWEEVAQANGLQFASNPVSYDYDYVGTQTWDFPGMVGEFRGRNVQIQSGAGIKGSQAGKMLLVASIQLKKSVPFSALARKQPFADMVKEHIKKDTKTNHKPIDRNFKVRSEDTDFLVKIFERVDIGESLKQQKFKTAHILFDGQSLRFEGALGGWQGKPEQAIELLNLLCDVAEAAEN